RRAAGCRPKRLWSCDPYSAFRIKPRYVAELALPRANQLIDGGGLQFRKMLFERRTQHFDARIAVGVNARGRLGNDFIDAAEGFHIGCGNTQCLRRAILVGDVALHDSRSALRRNDGVNGVFENEHAIGDGQRQRATRAAFTGNDGNSRHSQTRHFADVARDSFRLAALLGAQSRISRSHVDQRNHGSIEFFRNLHGPQRLAVALGAGHAEVALDALLGSAALADADDQHLFATQPGHAAGHRLVVAKGAIPVNLTEVGKDALDQLHGIGPLRVPRLLDFAPCRQNGLCLGRSSCFFFTHRIWSRTEPPPALNRFYGLGAVGTNTFDSGSGFVSSRSISSTRYPVVSIVFSASLTSFSIGSVASWVTACCVPSSISLGISSHHSSSSYASRIT